jgi:hypothetical protein
MTRHISIRMRMKNHTVNHKEEEVPEEDRAVEEVLLEEEEEEEEEKQDAMPMERHGTCLGNVPRKRNKEEVKLTFQKHREGMLKQKEKRMEYPRC